MSPKTPTRRSPPVLLLSMVTGQMFTTGSDEWEIGNGEGGTRGRGGKGTRGQEISFSSSPCLPLSPCPLVPLSPCLLVSHSPPAHARTASIIQRGDAVRITRVSRNPEAASNELNSASVRSRPPVITNISKSINLLRSD